MDSCPKDRGDPWKGLLLTKFRIIRTLQRIVVNGLNERCPGFYNDTQKSKR